jgi:hypothetical protein
LLDIFHTLSEVSVAVTGFSSLIIIFRGNATPWSRHDYIHFGFVLAWSIGSIFLSLLPILLAEFDIDIARSARIGLIATLVYIGLVGGLLTRAQNRATRERGQSPPLLPRVVMSAIVFALVTLAILAAAGVLPGPLHAWYAVTIVALLALATGDLGIFVVHSTRAERAG